MLRQFNILCYSFITASKSGLSETEIEDILCLDERVLDEVFQFTIPEGINGGWNI